MEERPSTAGVERRSSLPVLWRMWSRPLRCRPRACPPPAFVKLHRFVNSVDTDLVLGYIRQRRQWRFAASPTRNIDHSGWRPNSSISHRYRSA